MKYIVGISLAIILVVGVVAGYLQIGYNEPKEETPVVKKKEEPVVKEEPEEPKGNPNQATLPKEHETLPDPRISDMKVGDVGYAWASSMRVDKNKKCWLNPYTLIYESYSPYNTISKIKITRTELGYEVELLSGYKWYPSDSYTEGWIPIVKFIGYKEK